MTLKRHFFTNARLWSEVVISSGVHVFIPTVHPQPVGTTVEVEFTAPDLSEPLLITGTVDEFRPLAPPQPAGLFITLSEASLERCRALVGQRTPQVRMVGRSEPRVDCSLAARLIKPRAVPGCAVKSLSTSGVALMLPEPVPEGILHFAVQLPAGAEVTLIGQVMWSRPELRLAGLKFLSLDAMTERTLRAAMDSIASAQQQFPMVAKTVLVADDDGAILDFTSRIVSKLGHRVLRAERGDKALELVRSERPHLVLLDVLMPGLDGLEVCKAIRSDAALAHTPVILLSAMGEDRLPEAAKNAGADGYLTKPMRLEALRALILERLPTSKPTQS